MNRQTLKPTSRRRDNLSAYLRPAARPEIIALLGILSIAAWLRFGWTGVFPFSFDQARVSHLALQMVREGKVALLGMQSSTGVPNFPAAVWIFALPYAFTTDPQAATWLVGSLNLLAVTGVWWLGRKAWGALSGLAAALLFATSPYLVFYSRSIWSQNLLAPFAIFWAMTALMSVTGPARYRSLFLAATVFLAGFVGQIHYAGFALALGTLWLLARWRLWRRWRAVAAGSALALLAAAPSVILIWRQGAGARADLRQALEQPAAFDWGGFVQVVRLYAADGWEQLWLNSQWQWPSPLEGALALSILLLALLLAGGVLRQAYFVATRDAVDAGPQPSAQTVLTGLLVVWGLASPLLFLYTKTDVFRHYHLVSAPALFLAAGSLTAFRRPAWLRPLLLLALIAVALVQTVAIARTLTLVGREQVPGGMGTPLLYPRQAAAVMKGNQQPVVVETHGDNPAFDGDAAVFDVLLWDTPHQLADARSALLIPDRPAQLFFTFASLPAWEVAQSIGVEGSAQTLPRRRSEPPYLVLAVDGPDFDGFTPAPPATLANGADLRGWQVIPLAGGEQVRLITHWRIGADPLNGHYQQFNHLYLQGEAEPQEIRDVATSSRAWQPGDHLITWADFTMPAEAPAYFHVGMYTWPDLQRSPILNRDGDPLAPIRLDLEEDGGALQPDQ